MPQSFDRSFGSKRRVRLIATWVVACASRS